MLQCTLILRKQIILVLTEKNFSLKVFVRKSTTKGEGFFH